MYIRIIEREVSMKLNRTTLRTVEILKLVSKKPDGITLDEICRTVWGFHGESGL